LGIDLDEGHATCLVLFVEHMARWLYVLKELFDTSQSWMARVLAALKGSLKQEKNNFHFDLEKKIWS